MLVEVFTIAISVLAMTPLLFVYGTLMTAAASVLGREQRARLQGEATSFGAATLSGRLYDIGRYPGLIESVDPAEIVHGEMFALADPMRSFAWLDPYESIRPDGGDANEYERAERTARLATGEQVQTWVYLYRHDLSAARFVPGGRWLPD